MQRFLCLFFAAMALIMTLGLTWASLQENMFALPPAVLQDPWFWVTCADVYCGLALATLWMVSVEKSTGAKWVWGVLFFALGNVLVALYGLQRAWRMAPSGTLQDFFAGHCQTPPSSKATP